MSGGYDYEFVDTPLDMVTCKICYLPSREPHLSDCCGHTFCKSCLTGYEVSVSHPLTNFASCGGCPMCRSEDFKCVRNKQTERMVKSLRVYCTNKSEGCKWQGEVSSIDSHLADYCQYQMVDCPNDCGRSFQQQHLIDHVENECIRRSISCSLCYTSGEHQFIEGQHKKYCPKFPLTCPNECGTSMLREDIDEHRKTCPLEKVNCPNNCGISSPRQSLNVHVASECPCRTVNCQHCHTSGEYQLINGQHKDDCPKFPLSCPNNCKVETIPREEMQAHLDTTCPQMIVQCEYHLVGCEARVTRGDLEKHKKESMEAHLSMTLQQLKTTHATMNKVTADFHTRINEIEAAMQTKVNKLESKVHLDSTLVESLVGKWVYKIHSQALDPSLKVIPLIVKMSEFISQQLWSTDYFFTHTEGYKIKLSMTIVKAVLAQLTYFSLSIYITDGPYDNNLPWPMTGMFKITLLNQIRDDEHYPPVVVTYFYNNPVGQKEVKQIGFVKRFINHDHLYKDTETCRFVKYNGVILHIDIVDN